MTDKSIIRIVLEAVESSTECVVETKVICVTQLCDLSTSLGIEPEHFDPRREYDLNPAEYQRIQDQFHVTIERQNCRMRLRSWRRIDALSYDVHTNRELILMLSGKKPLSAFVGEYPSRLSLEEIPEKTFDPYVKVGRFVKRECVCDQSWSDDARGKRKIRRVLYAQPGQEWRIDAYLLLYSTAEKSGWSEGFERLEGSLLGYEDWENDEYIRVVYRASKAPEGQSRL